MSLDTRPGVCIHGSLRRSCEACDLADRLELAEAQLAEARAQVERLTLRVGYLTSQIDPEHENFVGVCLWCQMDIRDAYVSFGDAAVPYHVECYGHLMKKELDEARALLTEATREHDNRCPLSSTRVKLPGYACCCGAAAWNTKVAAFLAQGDEIRPTGA